MLPARSPEECHLYLELHPCSCGQAVFAWSAHRREERDGRLISVYEGVCGQCGTARRFEFEVPAEVPPPPAYGGEAPSQIIDPGEFLAVARRLAGSVPPEPTALLDPEELEDAYELLEMAVAALDEVLKFLPAGADAVPEAAFGAGREAYAGDPARFTRDRLVELRSGYLRRLSRYAEAAGR